MSAYVGKYLPCTLTIKRFGFIWIHEVLMNFVNGELLVLLNKLFFSLLILLHLQAICGILKQSICVFIYSVTEN